MVFPLYLGAMDVNAVVDAFNEIMEKLVQTSEENAVKLANASTPEMDVTVLVQGLRHFMNIFAGMCDQTKPKAGSQDVLINNHWHGENSNVPAMSQKEMSEIGDHGLMLLDAACDLAESLNLKYQKSQMSAIMVVVALWVARHGGKLRTLETVVDTMADFGNSTSDTQALTALCEIMGEIVRAASNELRFDFDNQHPGRPWRVLNINRGIIATRTRNPRIMEVVFDELIRNVPDDAKDFFETGMQQVDELDYPGIVREVMVRYHRQQRPPVLH